MGALTYVFCHGLDGWGQYDRLYAKHPYWGGRYGDVVAQWRAHGLDAHAASVAPKGSAWDRACELYAQLAGTRTDYGAAHAATYRHERFGPDFTGRALIPAWDDDTRLVLIGHSFGGATIRLLAELLAHGDETERAAAAEGAERAGEARHATEGVSPLFVGGMGERVFAIVTIAVPTNGTTACDFPADASFDARAVEVPLRYRLLDRVLKSFISIKGDERDPRDWANHDMFLDHAQALNARIETLPHVYYLSVACDATLPGEGDVRVPDPAAMDPLFVKTATIMGRYRGVTKEGRVMDGAWHANDGLVNTISAHAPFDAPQRPLDKDHIERGVWNVMPDLHAHHAFVQGGFYRKSDPRPFFDELRALFASLDGPDTAPGTGGCGGRGERVPR